MTSIRDQVDTPDSRGDTPLHVAARANLFNHISSLIAHGAEPLARNRRGALPFQLTSDIQCQRLLAPLSRSAARLRASRKILIVGNTNNYPLLLAEGLRALGHDTRLIVTRTDLRHRPESKYPQWTEIYPDWIFDWSTLHLHESAQSGDTLREALAAATMPDAELSILNDVAPSIADHLPRPLMSMLTGSDLTYYANPRTVVARCADWDKYFLKSAEGQAQIAAFSSLIDRQRDGIRASRWVSFAAAGLIREGDELLGAMGISAEKRMTLMMSDTRTLQTSPLPPAGAPLRVFNGARHDWVHDASGAFGQQDLKGTDRLLKGFARYCHAGGRGSLHLVRKGKDLAASDTLINELGISPNIVWIDRELSLHDYHEEVRRAHLVCDQFAQSFPGMVSLDAWALGRPVLANLRNEIFREALPVPLPGFQATSPEHICAHLLRLDTARHELSAMAEASRLYAENWLSPETIASSVIDRCFPA